jgi:alkylated DNA repair dioxygenase AlkB
VGSVGIGYHSDADDPVLIASISFGAVRQMGFCATHGTKLDPSLPQIALAAGSLLLFDDAFNSHYKHGIQPDASIRDPRICVTFRAFSPKPQLVK